MLSFETNVFRNARTMLDLAKGFFQGMLHLASGACKRALRDASILGRDIVSAVVYRSPSRRQGWKSLHRCFMK
jgi:hypothetical protein